MAYIPLLFEKRRASSPWALHRNALENVRPHYNELRTVHDMPAGSKTWRCAVQCFHAEIVDAERSAYGY